MKPDEPTMSDVTPETLTSEQIDRAYLLELVTCSDCQAGKHSTNVEERQRICDAINARRDRVNFNG